MPDDGVGAGDGFDLSNNLGRVATRVWIRFAEVARVMFPGHLFSKQLRRQWHWYILDLIRHESPDSGNCRGVVIRVRGNR